MRAHSTTDAVTKSFDNYPVLPPPRLPRTVSSVQDDGNSVRSDDLSVIGSSAGLADVVRRVEQVAPTDAPVLFEGETGSGKEVLAQLLHARSLRSDGPMLRVNCGAIPAELLDSELFGHERGSFTGATGTRRGWFERANGGTLFLDEVAELPLPAQVRLLRVLQEGTFTRVGGSEDLRSSVRVITATHRDLRAMCTEGTFRLDLWFRISVFTVRIPPLRDRPEDLPALAAHFARGAGVRLTGTPLVPTERELAALAGYPWPGNVRELAAVIERAAILGGGHRLAIDAALGDEPPPSSRAVFFTAPPVSTRAPSSSIDVAESSAKRSVITLDEVIRQHIEGVLAMTHGRIEGPNGAARLLGVNPHSLRGKMRKLRIDWARYRSG